MCYGDAMLKSGLFYIVCMHVLESAWIKDLELWKAGLEHMYISLVLYFILSNFGDNMESANKKVSMLHGVCYVVLFNNVYKILKSS